MQNDKVQRIATSGFGVIHDLVGHVELEPGDQERLIRQKCDNQWRIPFSEKTSISRATILRWMKLYRDSGGKLESLDIQDRSDQGKSRAMDQETSLALISLRKEFPKATVRFLIDEMEKRKLVSPGLTLNPSTVYRFLHRHDLMELSRPVPEDRRKFEAELPNDLWQVDCMHGPRVEHQDKRRQTYLVALMDDHSRLVPHGEFFLPESVKSFLVALEGALLTRGLPRKIHRQRRSVPFTSCGACDGLAGRRSHPRKALQTTGKRKDRAFLSYGQSRLSDRLQR
ncbi:hypothetical protein ACFL2Q_13295 [Thermodesulfobacteriota bacterium]